MVLADVPPDAMADDDDDAAGAEDDDAAGADEVGAAADVLDEGDELHAAAPTARPAAMPDTASRRRFFTVFSLFDVCSVRDLGAG
jgi:hypothetical protein